MLIKVFSVVCMLSKLPPGGGGGGGGGTTGLLNKGGGWSNRLPGLVTKSKLWNFHRYWLAIVRINVHMLASISM